MADGKQNERELRKNILRANMTVNREKEKTGDSDEKPGRRRGRWFFVLSAVFLIVLVFGVYFYE